LFSTADIFPLAQHDTVRVIAHRMTTGRQNPQRTLAKSPLYS